MKKLLPILMGLLLFCISLIAQNNITYTKMADSLLTPVSKTQITTGILYDRVVPFAALHSFKATDTSSYRHFMQAYTELFGAAYNNTSMMKVEKVDTLCEVMYGTNSVVPIGVLYFDFNLIDTFAITNNLFYKGADSLLHDVVGRTGNPFKLKTITIAAALPQDTLSYGTGSVIFKYSSQLFLNNKSVTITSIYADFGSGNQNLTSGSNVTVSYPSAGMKTIKFTITYSNSQTATVYSKLYLKSQSVSSRLGQPIDPDELVNFDDTQYGYQGFEEQEKKYNRGSYGIYYHRTSPGGPKEMILKKPIIILDGFDPSDARGPRDLFGVYLQYTLTDNFGNDMLNKGYDVIVLNFPEKKESLVTIPGMGALYKKRAQGADFIQRNAFLLVTLIKQINAKLVLNGSTEKLVIIGPSMGGLISRYALRWMELNGETHNTRLWISFDAPHKGANIPIGDQYFVDFYATKANNKKAKEGKEKSLNSAAAKQMLLHHFAANSITPAGAPNFRNNWQAELDNMGYPQNPNLRKIALINGAINGTTQGAACENVFDLKVQLYTPNMFFFFAGFVNVAEGDIWFTGNYGNACQVFKGWAKAPLIDLAKTAAATSSSKSYDILPGGYFNTQEQIVGERVTDSYIPLLGAITTIFLGTRTYTNSHVLNPIHCFIPTFSSLGMNITNKDLSENLYNRDLACSGETPFQAYFAPQVNQEHITLTTENVTWIKNEIDGIKQMSSVNYSVLYPIVKTAGTDPVCATATYQINNLPTGSTISWVSSNSGIATISPFGNPTTITRQGSQSGNVTFTATVTRTCGEPIYLTKTLTIGSPSFPYSISGASPANPNGGYTYSLLTTPTNKSISNIVWTVPSGWSITLGQGTRNLKVTTGTASGNVQVSFNDACGKNWGTYKFVTIGPGGPDPDFVDPEISLMVSPNPTSTTLNIALDNRFTDLATKKNSNPTQGIREIVVTDQLGVVKKRIHYSNSIRSTFINVSTLQSGTYFIRVFDGTKWRHKQLLIAK